MDCTHYVETINWQTFESVQTTNKNNKGEKNPLAQKHIIKLLGSNKEAGAGSLWADIFKSLAGFVLFCKVLSGIQKSIWILEKHFWLKKNLESYAVVLCVWTGNLEYPQHSSKFGEEELGRGVCFVLSCEWWRLGFSDTGSCICYRGCIARVTVMGQMRTRSTGVLGGVN